jgi:hypothetical protein
VGGNPLEPLIVFGKVAAINLSRGRTQLANSTVCFTKWSGETLERHRPTDRRVAIKGKVERNGCRRAAGPDVFAGAGSVTPAGSRGHHRWNLLKNAETAIL